MIDSLWSMVYFIAGILYNMKFWQDIPPVKGDLLHCKILVSGLSCYLCLEDQHFLQSNAERAHAPVAGVAGLSTTTASHNGGFVA